MGNCEMGNLDKVLEALENFERRFPNLPETTRLYFVLGGMSAGEQMWTSNDMMKIINYFTKGEKDGKDG